MLYFREYYHCGPEVVNGKAGHDLPIRQVGDTDPEDFAAYTAPEGGLTSISRLEDRLSISMQEADYSEDLDFVDLYEFTSPSTSSNKRRPYVTDDSATELTELENTISKSYEGLPSWQNIYKTLHFL